MSFARSSSTTSSTQQTYQQQVQAGEGSTAVGAGATLVQTDLGAIKQAAALGSTAIQGAVDVSEAAQQNVKSIAQTAIGAQSDVVTTALNKGAAGFTQYAQSLSDLASLQASKDSQARLQELELASELSGQVVRANQPADVTVTEAATTTVKYLVAAVVAIGAVLLFLNRKTA